MSELATRKLLKEYIVQHINDNTEGDITAEEVRTAMLGIVENSMRVNNDDYTGNKIVISDNEGFVIESDYTTTQLEDALGNVIAYTAGNGIDISENGEISIDSTQLNEELENDYTQLNPDNLSIDSNAKTFCAHPFRVNENTGEGEDPIIENNIARGNYSTAFGFECLADNGASNSFVAGDQCKVYHEDCFVAGEGLKTAYDHQTIFGKYNVDSDYNSWGNKKPVFFIGGGSSNTNRVTLLAQQGNNGDLCCAGGFANNAGFDFAEYFEWADGNESAEDRIGYMVKLVEAFEEDGDGNHITTFNKIELADSFSECIGVTTGTYGFVCDSQLLDWQGKYVKDEFGRHEIDKFGNLQISEDYDASKEYVPREFRKEWIPVGMIGKILTKQNGSLVAGGYATCSNGVAVNSTDGGYRVLKVINENVALLLVK